VSETPENRWFGPQGSARFHYFNDDLRSLCGKWMLWRDPAEIDGLGWGVALGNANGDCAGCKKKLAALAPVVDEATS
jgi:hypothetical protein